MFKCDLCHREIEDDEIFEGCCSEKCLELIIAEEEFETQLAEEEFLEETYGVDDDDTDLFERGPLRD